MDSCSIKWCREFKHISNLICRESHNDAMTKNVDKVTLSHGWIIGYLYENRDRVVLQREFEKEFNLRRSTVTTMLQTMEKNGLIERRGIENDARQRQLILTEKAKSIHNIFVENMEALDNKLIKGIDEKELEVFYNVLCKMKRNLEEK